MREATEGDGNRTGGGGASQRNGAFILRAIAKN
jgi:hypothetical protein